MKDIASIAIVSVLALAGCQSSSGGSSAPQATGQVVQASQMPDFCRAQAAAQNGWSVQNISSDFPVTSGSGTLITGQWTSPVTGDQEATFECRFGPGGSFQRVTRTS
jgi:hypothetical protein